MEWLPVILMVLGAGWLLAERIGVTKRGDHIRRDVFRELDRRFSERRIAAEARREADRVRATFLDQRFAELKARVDSPEYVETFQALWLEYDHRHTKDHERLEKRLDQIERDIRSLQGLNGGKRPT